MWRSVTWPTIGCCVILKVFLGEHNGPFRVHPAPPEVLRFVSEDSCTAPFVFALSFDCPGMLERGMSTDCFEQNLACYQLGGLFIGEGGRDRTKSTKRSQEPTVWLWKRPETAFKGNKHLYSTSKPP